MEITSPPLPNIVPKSELMLLLINRGAFNLCSTTVYKTVDTKCQQEII